MILHDASYPSITGMVMSMSTRSGRRVPVGLHGLPAVGDPRHIIVSMDAKGLQKDVRDRLVIVHEQDTDSLCHV